MPKVPQIKKIIIKNFNDSNVYHLLDLNILLSLKTQKRQAASVQQLIDSKDVIVALSAMLAWTVLSFHRREKAYKDTDNGWT